MREGREGVAEGGWEEGTAGLRSKNGLILLKASVRRASVNLAVRQALVRRCFRDLGGQASTLK